MTARVCCAAPPERAGYLREVLLCCLAVMSLLVTARCQAPAQDTLPVSRPRILRIDLHDTLQPERATIFVRSVEAAGSQAYAAVLVDLSTPGGLSESTDSIVAAIRNSPLPVIVWVGSPQTRVSGQGLRLLEAADLALMNSSTFLTPLWTDRIHGYPAAMRADLSARLQQQLQDEALLHHRGTSQLDELSYGSHWFTAHEALETGLVDGIADRLSDVLRVASEHTITKHGTSISLAPLQNAQVVTAPVKVQEALLLTLMNPNICVLLLTLGMLLIYLEVNTPGAFVPGLAGILLAMLAMYALHLLPLHMPGVLLCLLASLMLVLEGRYPSYGLLAVAGVLFLVVGLGQLVDGPVPQLQVNWSVAWGAGIGFGGVTAALIVLGLRARQAKLTTGADAMLGWLATAQTTLAPEGKVLVRGELWQARLTTQNSSVPAGERVKVLRADGRVLEVAALPLGDSA